LVYFLIIAKIGDMFEMEILRVLIYVIYSFLAPIVTSGGGFLVSNALTFTGVSLIVATGMTSSYFLINGLIVVGIFWKEIAWKEVRQILPLAALGAVFGALFLTQLNPAILLSFMLYFALDFLYKGTIKKDTGTKESKLSTWSMSLLSGFLAGTALPGGGLRNSYLLSKGYTLSQVHGTTSFIGVIVWAIKIAVLLETSILVYGNFKAIFIAIPFLFIANILIRKGLLNLPKNVSKKISISAMALFSLYAISVLVYTLI
jgi:hypothetical protein